MPVKVGPRPERRRVGGPRWWGPEINKGKRWEHAMEAFDQARQAESVRLSDLLRFVRLYTNRDIQGISAQSYSQVQSISGVTLNGIRAVIDTVTSKVTRIRPVPKFVTTGGPYSLRRKAKLLERWCLAQLHLVDAHTEGTEAFIDAAVGGTGILKPYRVGSEIKLERVWPGNVLIDPVEAFHGRPQVLWEARWVDRSTLAARKEEWDLTPTQVRAIWDAPAPEQTSLIPGRDSGADQLLVMEGWRLPPGPNVPGRHLVFIEGTDLVDRPWTQPWFPHLFLRWSTPRFGVWGQGAVENLEGLQGEMNREIRRIAKAHRMVSTLINWVDQPTLSLIRRHSVTNEVGVFYPYAGQRPPVRDSSPIVPSEMYAQVNWYYQRMFEIEGVSQLAASGGNIGRIDSGEGFRTLNDIQSERFVRIARMYENMYRDLAKRLIYLAKEIDELEPDGFEIVAERDKMTLSRLKWKDVDLEEDAYQIRIFPASALPDDPGGRLASVQELYANGMVDRETALRMADLPDLDSELDLAMAPQACVDRDIEAILDEDRSMVPDPFVDPAIAVSRGRLWLAKAKTDGVPEGRLTKLRDYIREAAEMIEQEAADAALAQQALTAPVGAPGPLDIQ